MSVHVYLSGDPVHDQVLKAFYDGCPEEKRLCSVEKYEPSAVGVVFGIAKRAVPFSANRGRVIAEQTKLRQKVVVLETGFINRGDGPSHCYAAGFGGLNGRADFRNQNSDGVRTRVELEPWRASEPWKYILLCGQVPWDASVEHIYLEEWLVETYKRLKQITQRRIVFRPHPKAIFMMVGSEQQTGEINWDHVHAVVTFNSNLAVEAVLNGVPVFVDDVGSMALAVANRSLAYIESPLLPDRRKWLRDLSYAQWTPDEMRSGLTWKHLFQ